MDAQVSYMAVGPRKLMKNTKSFIFSTPPYPANPAHPREVLSNDRRSVSDNSNSYSVIYVTR